MDSYPFGKLDPFVTPYAEIDFRWLGSIKAKDYKVVKGKKIGFSWAGEKLSEHDW